MTRARNIAGFSTITTTPSPVHVGPIGVLTATRIDGEFNVVDIASRDITAQGIGVTNLQVSGITTGLNVSGIITAQNGINFNGTSTGLNVSGVTTVADLTATTISIGGTLTYEDVTNVDSVGVVTARGLSIFGNTTGLNATGISTVVTLNFSDTNFKIGSTAGDAITTGNNNIAIGIDAMSANTVGDRNTAVGHYSLTTYNPSSNEDAYLTAIGYAALNANTTGNYNTAVGSKALYAQTTSSNTVAIGYQAGEDITSTNNTTLIGAGAGKNITTGNGHTIIGCDAGGGITTSEGNVLIGQLAGNYNVTLNGGSNVYIGLNVRGSAASNDYELVFGRDADGKGSNTGFMKANSGMYQSNNSSSWSTTSDERIKKNIVDYNEGLSKILNVRVRNFEYRTEEEITAFENPRSAKIDKQGIQLGVIAQELEQVIPTSVSETSDGVKVVNDDDIMWHLVNAVKELSAKVEELESKLNN